MGHLEGTHTHYRFYRWRHCHSEWSVEKLTPHHNNLMLDVKKAIAGSSCAIQHGSVCNNKSGNKLLLKKWTLLEPLGFTKICKTAWSNVSSDAVGKIWWTPLVWKYRRHFLFARGVWQLHNGANGWIIEIAIELIIQTGINPKLRPFPNLGPRALLRLQHWGWVLSQHDWKDGRKQC